MTVDFHTHAFPDELAHKAIPLLAEKGGITAYSDGTAQGIVRSMDRDKIDVSVVLSIATKPKQETNVNNFAISLLENKRLVPFGSVFPGSENALFEIERLHEAGIKGIKLHPEYQQFFMDDEIVFPIYKKCGELGMLVLLHCGEDVGYPPPVHATPDRIVRTVSMFPETIFVAAHMGGYNLWDEFSRTVKAHDNLYIDTSMTNTVSHLDNKVAKRIFEIHGYDKFLFGSDSPWERPCKSMEKVLSYELGDENTSKILGENAKRLLNL